MGAILVVEDDDEIREDLSDALADAGFSVVAAHDGNDALSKMQSMAQPCLVLLDLMMPVMDGWELRREMLRRPELAQVPVFVVSAVPGIQEESKALEANGYLLKPFNVRQLLSVVEKYCTKRVGSAVAS